MKRTTERNDRVTLHVSPDAVLEGNRILVRGEGWPDCRVRLFIGEQSRPIDRIMVGVRVEGGVRPDPRGEFQVSLLTFDLDLRDTEVVAVADHRDGHVARASLRITRRRHPLEGREGEGRHGEGRDAENHHPRGPGRTGGKHGGDDKSDGRPGLMQNEEEREDEDLPYWRLRDWFKRRFEHIGRIPEGLRDTQIASVRALRAKAYGRGRFDGPGGVGPPRLGPAGGPAPSQPVPGVCNWTPVGSSPLLNGPTAAYSGRTLAVAIPAGASSTILLGTAGGGIWKSTDAGVTWSPKTDYNRSLAIGAIAIDPNNAMNVIAGTGEYAGAIGTYYGNGIFRSADGGETWTEHATSTFERDEISRIVYDPTDATGQRVYLSSSIGVFESLDGGSSWSALRAGAASDLVVLVLPMGGGTVKLIAGFDGSGLWTSQRTGGGAWGAWSQFADPAFPTFFGRIALGQCASDPKTIYAAFSSGQGIAGMAKTTNGGTGWSQVIPPLAAGPLDVPSTSASGHDHHVTVPAADLGAPAPHTYTSTSNGTPAHTHAVPLTNAQTQTLIDGTGAVNQLSTADATGHQHTFIFDRRVTSQSWYNFHITVDPSDPNTVYYGEVGLWKTTTGDGPWTQLPILHSDQHALAFDPTNPSILYAVNDGGVYRSATGGTSWTQRNRDLATLQYVSVAQHPDYEAVLLGGTQDNGTHRALGHPSWWLARGGDGGFSVIDPNTPTRMYSEYISSTFYRSDSSGDPGTWVLKNTGITGGAEFYAPFVLDPSDANVCYFGGSQLWRSPNNADSWTAVTSAIVGNVTAIAVHPTDPTTVYIATTNGRVYRVQRTGATWALANVTTTDLTAPNLPSGVYLSDLAVDPAGNIWLTVSSVLASESTGEFSNDHVYRRAVGGTTWESRSGGLAQANPVNTIVIDPLDSNVLYCGADVGVFRTDSGGMSWVPWDEGLPNVPVFDLALHHTRRLLRAATHGRSVWERPLAAAACPTVDLYLRDNVVDTGRVVPSPDGVPHPFNPATLVHHWQSADIKVDAEEGTPAAYQTSAPIDNYVDFEAAIQHRTARRTRTNRFYVQVHNRGVAKATNVQVRGFFADAHLGLPNLPADFWTGGRPFAGTPSGTDWTPAGPSRTFAVLEAGEPGVAEWDFVVPASANKHSCLLVVATCAEDPINGAGLFGVDALVRDKKHVALKNLNVEDYVPGAQLPDGGFQMGIRAPGGDDRVVDIVVHWGSLPREATLFAAFEAWDDGKPVVLAGAEELKAGGVVQERAANGMFRPEWEDRCGEPHRLEDGRVYVLRPAQHRETVISRVRASAARSSQLFLNLMVPAEAAHDGDEAQFDVMQRIGKKIVGGITFQLRYVREYARKER